MPTGVVILIVAVFLITDAVVVGALVYGFLSSVARPLAAAFPARPAREGVVRREFQSFGIDMFNFGLSIHAGADDEHLHLEPAMLARLVGMRPVSIPWDAITLAPGRAGAQTLRATVRDGPRSWSLRGPRWCLELAAPPPG